MLSENKSMKTPPTDFYQLTSQIRTKIFRISVITKYNPFPPFAFQQQGGKYKQLPLSD